MPSLATITAFDFMAGMALIFVLGILANSKKLTWGHFTGAAVAVTILQGVALAICHFMRQTDAAPTLCLLGYLGAGGFVVAALPPSQPATKKKPKSKEERYRIPPAAQATEPAILTVAELADSDIIVINGGINRKTAERFAAACIRAAETASDRPVTVRLTTKGGNLDQADVIITSIRALSARRTVRILAVGTCQSAGVNVLVSIPLGQRYCTSDTEFMLHRTTATQDGQTLAYESLTTEFRGRLTTFNEQLVRRLLTACAHLPEAALRHIFDEGINYYFDAAEAQRLGLVAGFLE